jgi:peptide/nickel transport system substrate-binding protein
MAEHVVPGESVSLVANPNYVFGAPVAERMLITRVDPSLIAEHMHNGTFDFIRFPTAEYGDHMEPENFTYVGTPVGDYTYICFRLGHWDDENGVNVYAPGRKMAQAGPLVRQAMAYAIDSSFIGDTIYHGLRFAPATNVTPNHRALIDTDVPGFPYNPDKARELLDEAGFDQLDDDGFRLDPNGNRFTINWAFREDPLTEDIVVPFFIESWADIGLRVELWRGQTHPALVLWDYLDFDADNDEVDIYDGGWIVGANPNPEGTWGHIWWNPSRYTSPEYDAILARMNTLEAFDPDYMKQVFSEWQWYWQENVPYFPYLWQIRLTAVNNRVTFFDTRVGYVGSTPTDTWHQIGLSAAQPYGR